MLRRVLFGAAFLALVPWAAAADKKAKPKAQPTAQPSVVTKNVGATIPSQVVARKVEKLTDRLDWHFALDDARSQAQRENKAVLWLHVLGDLDKEC